MYPIVSCMYLHVLHVLFLDNTETAATSSKRLLVGRHPAVCTQATQSMCAKLLQTLYFAIGVRFGDPVLTPARSTRPIPLKIPSESAGAAPMTNPRALIGSHAQSQLIWRVGHCWSCPSGQGASATAPQKPILAVFSRCMYHHLYVSVCMCVYIYVSCMYQYVSVCTFLYLLSVFADHQ